MNSAEIRTRLADNLRAVEARMAAACARVGRNRAEVTLVAVTKYVGVEAAAALLELGVTELGESRPQELWRKAEALPADVHWHLVGHLQRNKIERTLPLVRLIHSVDSVRLLQALSAQAGKARRPIDVLIEVNLSREPNKHGFAPADVPPLLDAGWPYPGVFARGLMTMAAEASDPQECRGTFAELRALRERIRQAPQEPLDHRRALRELSMGMTHDFEIAIEEGATLVRVGSALFAGITE